MKELEDAERKAADSPQDTDAQYILGRICYGMGLHDKARVALKSAARDSRRDLSVLTYFGRMHMKEGEFELALKDFQEAEDYIVAISDRIEVLHFESECLAKSGRHGEAQRLKERVEKLMGDSSP
jgi:tetratricopeptide (TPR) repeat protein